jgi:hypothetical protein
MIALDYPRTNLKLWLSTDNLTAGGVWSDLSGNGNDFTRTGTVPLVQDLLNGMAGLYFNGNVSQAKYQGPAQSAYMANLCTQFVVFSPDLIISNNATPALNDCLMGSTVQAGPGFFLKNDANPRHLLSYNNDGAAQTVSSPIVSADSGTRHYYIGLWNRNGSGLFGNVDDPFNMGNIASGNPANLTGNGKIGENYNATTWFNGYIFEILSFNISLSNKDAQHIVSYLASKWFSPSILSTQCSIIRGNAYEQARDVGSRYLAINSEPPIKIAAKVTPEVMSTPVLSNVAISHRALPSWDGKGVGYERWQRTTARILESQIGGDLTCTLGLRDTRRTSRILRCRLVPRTTGLKGDGIAIAAKSAVAAFFRDSNAWIADPGDGRYVSITPEQIKWARGGLLIEGAAKNNLLRSSFKSGLTGLTQTLGSGAIALDTTAPLAFDLVETPNGCKLTAGTPTATTLAWPATASIAANTKVRFWCHYRSLDNTTLGWKLQRGVDSWYWNNAGNTWQSGTVTNTFAGGADQSEILRPGSRIFSVGTGATTLTLTMVEGPSASSSRHILYHLELNDDAQAATLLCAGSPIMTDTAVYTRAVDQFVFNGVSNVYGVFPTDPDHFHTTIRTIVVPEWDSADIASNAPTIWWATGSTGNGPSLVHDGTSWKVYADTAGGTPAVSLAGSVVAGQVYDITVRFTSHLDGELGLPADTVTLFVNGVSASGTYTHPIPATLYGGVSIGIGAADAFCQYVLFDISPWCDPDDEIIAQVAA